MAEPTKYSIIKNAIISWVLEGKVKPGEKIHSENQLVKMFGVSRHTVRQAIGDLVHEGWLYREQGSGTFCSYVENDKNKLQKNSRNIGVITTYISDYIFPSIIRGIESYLSSKGYSLIMASTNNDINKERECLTNMLDKGIDGLIVEPTKSSSHNPNIDYYLKLERKNTPYIMINQYYQELYPPHLIMDDELGGFIVTEHLIKYGHEKIIGLFKSDDMQGVNRMKGFIRAFREQGLAFYPDMVTTFTTENRDEKTSTFIDKVLRSNNPPTAIVCYNDEIAINVLQVTRELGLKIPDDVSIVGYDDSQLSVATEVKLTSVSHPKMDMGKQAARRIVAKVEGRDLKEEPVEESMIYEPKLVIRESTRRINKGIK